MKNITKFIIHLLMAAGVLLIVGCKNEEENLPGSIAGIVTDANTGEPVRSANIMIVPRGESAVSGSDGHYEFINLNAGSYTVQVSKSGYITNTKTIVVPAGGVGTGDIAITPSSGEMSLSVSYVDFGTSLNVATFQIINNAANGNFQWTAMKEGTADWLTVSPTGGSCAAGQQSPVTLTVNRALVTSNQTVNVRVTNTTSGNSISLPVSVSYNSGEMSLSVNYIDFGTTQNIETFHIINNASSGTFQWSIVKEATANWLTISPTNGSCSAGQHSQITLTVDRSQVTSQQTVNLRVNNITSGNSITLPVSVGYNSGTLQVSPNPVDFGTTSTNQQLTIFNSGSTAVTYEINYSCAWLTVSPTGGTVPSGSSATIALTLDRNAFSGETQTMLQVRNTSNGSYVNVTVNASNNGSDPGGGIVVSNGLSAYYTFDDGTATDVSGNNAHGSFMNGATTVGDGSGGNYLQLYSTQASYLNIPYNFFTGLTHWTVSFWAKDMSVGNVFGAQNPSHSQYNDVPRLWANNEGLLEIRCSEYTDGVIPFSYNYSNNSGSWHFYTIVMDGMFNNYQATVKLYVDGVLVDNITPRFVSSTVNSNSRIQIGGDKGGGYSVAPNMKIDNIRFYGRTLTISEIQTIYNNEM